MRRLIVIAALLGFAGCVTPSIPIPPPEPTSMTFTVTAGPNPTAVFEYEPNNNYADATVFVFNRDLGVGIIATAAADGSVGPTSPVAAELGHEIVVSFQLDQQTVSRCIVLQNGPQNPNSYCGL